MAKFNFVERAIAKSLSQFPMVKAALKYIYIRIAFLMSKKPYKYTARFPLSPIGNDRESSFFGYYDKSPVNQDGLTLSHIVNGGTKKKPTPNDWVKIAVFDNGGNEIMSVMSRAYNWQQGTRAQWLDNDLFIFNDYVDDEASGKYISRVFSAKHCREMKSFDLPVQDSYSTDYFLSINYQRLMALRPDYGYRNLPKLSDLKLGELQSDGIWKIDYESGDAKLLVSIKSLLEFSTRPEFSHARHKVNHVMISPNGKKFIFLHRYLLGKRRFDRLFVADAISGDLELLSDNEMVSHCFWINSDQIVGYMRGPSDYDGYWVVDVVSGKFERLANGLLDSYGDGHPHISGKYLVTDTYPDKSRMQHLLLLNMETMELAEIGSFYHDFCYEGETRCDLHPRLSPNGDAIFIDSVFSGRRRFYKMELVG